MAKPSESAPRSKARATSDATVDTTQSGATLGFEAKLWLTADKLRNNMDAAEYKHVVLGLIFLKYTSDTFDEHHAKLVAGMGDYARSQLVISNRQDTVVQNASRSQSVTLKRGMTLKSLPYAFTPQEPRHD